MALLFFIEYLIPIFALLSLFLQSIAARRGRNFTGTEDQRHERENEQTGCQRWPQHLSAARDLLRALYVQGFQGFCHFDTSCETFCAHTCIL